MVALPLPTAVISPLSFTVATASSLLVNCMPPAVPLFSAAVSFSVSPTPSVALAGVSLTDFGALFTVTFSVAVQPLWLRKVSVTLPVRAPVMQPSSLSVTCLALNLSME